MSLQYTRRTIRWTAAVSVVLLLAAGLFFTSCGFVLTDESDQSDTCEDCRSRTYSLVGETLQFMHAPHSNDNLADFDSDDPREIPYEHPLQAATEENLVFEVVDSPEGLRYAAMDGVLIHGEEEDPEAPRTHFSGIGLVPRREVTQSEWDARLQAKIAADPDYDPEAEEGYEPIAEQLTQLISNDPDAYYDVVVSLDRTGSPNPVDFVNDYLQRGYVTTLYEYKVAYRDALLARRAAIEEVQGPVIDFIQQRDGEIYYVCEYSHCVSANVRGGDIEELADLAAVVRVDFGRDELSDDQIMGMEVRQGAQLNQFIDDGYTNNWSYVFPGQHARDAAVFERHHLSGHNGFNTGGQFGNLNIDGYRCGKSSCVEKSWASTWKRDHPNAVTGLLLGDAYFDGYTGSPRVNRSGYAIGTNDLLFISAFDLISERADRKRAHTSLDKVLSKLNDLTFHVMSMSASFEGNDNADTRCWGTTTICRHMNELYESGVVTFKSSGNNGDPDPNGDCTLDEPAAAAGVFTVGGHAPDRENGTASTVQSGPIANFSDRGGVTWIEGRSRTILDGTGPSGRTLMFDKDGNYSFEASATSFSTPTVASFALLFTSHYLNEVSTLMDNPGNLFAAMLLMGDRQGAGGKLNTEFSSRWGAGRMTMRRMDRDGLDTPWGYWHTTQCVGHREDVELEWPYKLKPDTDIVKANIFWYDPSHEYGQLIDDVDLYYYETDDRQDWGSRTRLGGSFYDNKERVYHQRDSNSGEYIKFVISGFRVDGGSPGCPEGKRKVHFSMMYEDSDRDDADGPTNNIPPE